MRLRKYPSTRKFAEPPKTWADSTYLPLSVLTFLLAAMMIFGGWILQRVEEPTGRTQVFPQMAGSAPMPEKTFKPPKKLKPQPQPEDYDDRGIIIEKSESPPNP